MILDKQLEFADGQSLASAAGTVISTNVVDLSVASQWLAEGAQDVSCVIQIDTTVVGATATIVFDLVTSAVAALTTPQVHWSSGVIAIATLVAGYEVARFKLPSVLHQGATKIVNYLRFLGVRYTVATATTTAGAYSAFLVRDTQANLQYSSGLTLISGV